MKKTGSKKSRETVPLNGGFLNIVTGSCKLSLLAFKVKIDTTSEEGNGTEIIFRILKASCESFV